MNEEIPTIEPYRELWKREEQDNKELREEIERLNNIINKAIEILESIPVNANGGDILECERKVYHTLKGDNNEEM